MARVVQRRSSPPYLLFIVLLLFLVATTLWVIKHMEADKAAKENARLLDQSSSLATASDLQSGDIQEMIKDYKAARRKGDKASTVISQLKVQNEQLAIAITGKSSPYKAAKDEADRVVKLLGASAQRGLAVEIRLMKEKLDGLAEANASLQQTIADKDKQIEGNDTALKALEDKLSADIQTLQKKLAKREEDLRSEQKSHELLRGKAEKVSQDKINSLQETITKLNVRIDQLKQDLRSFEVKIVKKDQEVEELRGLLKIGGDSGIMPRVVGEISTNPGENGICYINIGKKEGIVPGFTFAVYPRGNITKQTKSNGALLVMNSLDNSSECRITKSDKNSPVSKGDAIANVVYDKKRKYTFVVEGNFDLHGSGRPTADGAEEVKKRISFHGGQIGQDVEVKTDYLVLGELNKPTKPSESASVSVKQDYRQKMEVWNQFVEAKNKAAEMHIPVLNTNRFLDYIGMIPTQKLDYER